MCVPPVWNGGRGDTGEALHLLDGGLGRVRSSGLSRAPGSRGGSGAGPASPPRSPSPPPPWPSPAPPGSRSGRGRTRAGWWRRSLPRPAGGSWESPLPFHLEQIEAGELETLLVKIGVPSALHLCQVDVYKVSRLVGVPRRLVLIYAFPGAGVGERSLGGLVTGTWCGAGG